MALAGDHEDILGLEGGDRRLDGVPPVADIPRLGHLRQNLGADRRRLLAARIVVGDDAAIGQPPGKRAHDRALAAVPVAAATEDQVEATLGVGPNFREHGLERVGRMGVIHENARALVGGRRQLQPAGNAAQGGERLQRRVQLSAGRDHQAQGGQGVDRLEHADQRQVHRIGLIEEIEEEPLPIRQGFPAGETKVALGDAERETLVTAFLASLAQRLVLDRIGVQHGGTAVGQKFGEEAHLGGEIALHVAVIVEVVARQVGEGRRLDPDPVQAELVEAMTGGLHDQVIEAVLGKPGETAVQIGRVGRGQRSRRLRMGRRHPQGAEAGRLAAQALPDLAREVGDRGLAVGPGHGGHGFRLPPEEARRQEREVAPRVVVGHQGDSSPIVLQRRVGGGEDRDRALVDRVVDIAAAVARAAGQGREEVARGDLAAIRGQPPDINLARHRHGL